MEESEEAEGLESVPGRGLRWPVAAALVVSALLYLPRKPADFLSQGGPAAWILPGLAVVCLTLGVIVVMRDRAGVWSATIMVGIGLVSMHALTSVIGVNVWDGAVGGLLPWPTGASVVTAGLTALLSVTALLYHSDRSEPTIDLPVCILLEAEPNLLDTPLCLDASTPVLLAALIRGLVETAARAWSRTL
ncbi:hypothetical protein [Streptomyces sp. NPDC093093]|uniref:hypothetical protein n=1 Tax=Streptomyces sp. NPDC093093 TaxID=3366025 RepID=UPI0038309620